MKKKLSSIIATMFIVMISMFAIGCGDKYKNLEFQVFYAFSEDSAVWYDGTNGISLNYNPDDVYMGGEKTSLIFDDNGATLYVKVQIKNVKSKHVDTITLSPTSMQGLSFSSATVSQDQVVAIPITGNVNTTIKVYENNSGKKHDMPLTVSKKLEKIKANTLLKPAMPLNGSIDLASLDNLSYLPEGETNQIGVTYSVESIGYFRADTDGDGFNDYISMISSELASQNLLIKDNVLSVKASAFYSSTDYVVEIKATSIYHDGSGDEDPIDAVFYVYLTESNVPTPLVKFNDIDGKVLGQGISDGPRIDVYENGGNYSKSTIYVDTDQLADKKYFGGLNVVDGQAKYVASIYVLNSKGVWQKYDFKNQESENENGLYVTKDGDNKFIISILNGEIELNQIKVVYEVEGLDFSSSSRNPISEFPIKVYKGSVPSYITVNDALDLNSSSDPISAVVYGTTSVSYKGLELKLAANPNSNTPKVIKLIDLYSGLYITDKTGKAIIGEIDGDSVIYKILSGSTIYVKFKNGVSTDQVLRIKTLAVPTEEEYYNEEHISSEVVNNDANYIIVQYNITQLVTADKFEFVPKVNSNDVVDKTYIDATKEDKIYVKVYYSGANLDTTTIKLTSNNEKMLFKNGTTEMSLSDTEYGGSGTYNGEKYNIYKVPIKATNSSISANITISVDDSSIDLEESINVSSVYLMSTEAQNGIDVVGNSANIKKFTTAEVDNGDKNFAINKGEFNEFKVYDGNLSVNTIAKIELSNINVSEPEFSNTAINYNVISNSVFVATGKVAGKTQVLKLKVRFYVSDGDGTNPDEEVIVIDSKDVQIQIAVFDAIGNISANATASMIGYVNPYFTETSSSEINFRSYTSNYGTPANSVVFSALPDAITVGNASQIQVSIGYFDTLYNSGVVSIKFVSEDVEIDLLQSNSIILTNGGSNFLNGKIIVELTGDPAYLSEISLTLRAMRFGQTSSTLANVVIKIAKVDKAEKILVSGNSLVENELQFSFMNVADGGYAEQEFNASLQFTSSQVGENSLRFNDIETALTYVLYRYVINSEGEIISKIRIQDEFFDITFENGIVNVKAYKNLGGGLFKLVLATKDSYNQILDPETIIVEENHFETKYEITIRVMDGEIGSEYVIKTKEELNYINNNLNKHFVLGANLGENEIVNINPIGLINGTVNEFKGSLSGRLTTIIEGDQTVNTFYTIRILIENSATSNTYGDLFGFFAIVGEGAEVKHLNIEVKFANIFASTDLYGVKIGTIAAVNRGTIENVKVSINPEENSEEIDFSGVTGGGVDFGGVVGLNANVIKSSKFESYGEIKITSNAISNNIGLITGINDINAKVTGDYLGKESLDNFIFDVVADLIIENTSSTSSNYYVGSVCGLNKGIISGMLVGGQISMFTTNDRDSQTGAIGGIAGSSTEIGNSVGLATALSLNITSTSSGINVGGIVGSANETTIETVKYVSAKTTINGENILGTISGEALVGGIVANATNGSIKYASVESFVDKIYDETLLAERTFYTLEDGDIAAGLVASASGTNVENSFVRANISGKGDTYYLTTSTDETNTYFIGEISKKILSDGTYYYDAVTSYTNKTAYSVVNGEVYKVTEKQTITLSSYILPVVHEGTNSWTNIYVKDGENYVAATEFVSGTKYYYSVDSTNYKEISSVDTDTKDWTNIYIDNGGTYTKAEVYDSTKTYVEFDIASWQTYAEGLTTGYVYVWETKENYNVANINGVDLFFPYLIRSWDHDNDSATENQTEPLQIVEPKSITAEINQGYVTIVDSIYIQQFNYDDYASLVKETVIVNYFNGGNDEINAHNMFATKNVDETYNSDGLLSLSILPKDAQGGYAVRILGNGHEYAYINSSKQIVFTRASNQTPILVEIYSVFNPDIKIYVTFYSQTLFTELTLNSSSIYYAGEAAYDYEINAYTGQSNKIIAIDAENIKNSKQYSTIFDVSGISQYLTVEATSDKLVETKLEINDSNYDNITLRIREDLDEDEKIQPEEYELITFTLKLKSDYFGYYNGNIPHILNDVEIEKVVLKVNLYNSAKSIVVDAINAEITTSEDVEFNVTLTTDYINTTGYTNNIKVEKTGVNSNGEIYIDTTDSDGIRIALDVIEGDYQTLINNVNKTLPEDEHITHFAELFNVQIISNLYIPENETKPIGYKYNVLLELIDKREYRYITDNIKFAIIITADSNPDVNNEDLPIEVLLKPAVLTTARMENYVVNSLNVNTDYTTLVTNGTVETSIVEPGSLGNVMMIYLEPTYANVEYASIKTSSLYVPSLGKNVQMKFTQLVLDRRNGTNAFTTLYGENATTQQGDTLELRLISEIATDGTRVYNGVICVYIQLEEFSGLEASMTIELNVETSNGKIVTRTRDLLTTYLPGVEINYNEENAISNGYLIQKGTSANQVEIKIFGYQFNSNPNIAFAWNLPEGSDYSYGTNDDGSENKQILVKGSYVYLIGDYVTYYLNNNYNEVVHDSLDDSYTLIMNLNVAQDIPAPFSFGATLSLTTKDGQLKTSDDNKMYFYPTEYILNSVYVGDLANNRKNIAINKTKQIELMFTTDSETNDLTRDIYINLLEYAYGITVDYTKSIDDRYNDLQTHISTLTDQQKTQAQAKLAGLFSYYKNGTIKFSDNELHPEFEVNFVNNEILSITGVEKFSNLVSVRIWYGYKQLSNGQYVVDFSKQDKSLDFSFTLNVISNDEDSEIIVYSAEDIFNSTTGTWDLYEGANYVLMNDITLENVVPITTAIGSFDGNNRVISIKSFKVDDSTSDYGLFASIGTYSVEDPETEQTSTRQTILKNMIVNYGDFEGTLALNNNTTGEITFGGLVAKNNGGLIYNCDVMNLSVYDKNVDIIVSSSTKVTFGGLVGQNSGIVTNSRVGRSSYTRIIATKTTESSATVYASGLTFSIFNREGGNDQVNQYSIVAGGFVGSNSGTISSSYVAKTNIYNYSTNEKTNITAGFVGENSGTISYSYAKADDETVTSSNPYSTGYTIENKGNGIVSGFVYNNTGTISNSYSNLELKTKSAYISGFVYNNTGLISESYAATTMNSGAVDSIAEQPFVGVNSAGDLLSTGTLENTYYLMRSSTDDPYKDGEKDIAQGLNEDNFQNSEYLIGFAFVLSNSKAEREQGIWSYYTLDSKKRILPELMNANVVSHSYRYVVDSEAEEKELRNATSYAEGTANNPYIISNVEEYNEVFTDYGNNYNFIGYVRFINNIDFNDDEKAIQTRANFKLGSSSSKTSVEGNGMTISGIYLDVGEAIVEKIGLFAEIENAYIKNLNLNFATPTTDGQFSTTTARYSGGLAGTITSSAVININLHGEGTTLTGSNFVGGVAGIISGNSLVYGIVTNLNVKTSSTESYLYYNKTDYDALNIKLTTYYDYADYVKHLSYAGAIAGVLDLTKRSNVEYNVQFIDIRGDLMGAKTFEGRHEANIIAEYAGGVAGYASAQTESFRLRYFMGSSDIISGNTAVGGLYGVGLGGITASQVTAHEDIQYDYDTAYGEYIIDLQSSTEEDNIAIDTTRVGNMSLLQGYKYVGGLLGVGLNSNITAVYSKASISSGEIVGGLIGLSVASTITYSYAVPYIEVNENMVKVGGLIGSAYGVLPRSPERNSEIARFETLLRYKGVSKKNNDLQFTYSTLILDNEKLSEVGVNNATLSQKDKVVFDYISADYQDNEATYLQSNQSSNLTYVYAGTVNYNKDENEVVRNQTFSSNKTATVALYELYSVGDPAQTVAFQEVFSGWSLIKYWTLDEKKYFPLLNNESVDNFIDIDDESDIDLIRTNLDGNFRVIKDITISSLNANWVVSDVFTGVIVGEIEGSNKRPTITIEGLNPKDSGDSSGFFKETYEATINNLAFEWISSSSDHKAIDLSNVDEITMVSGLTCKDINSLISNVEVRVKGSPIEEAYLINETDKTIGGFGGIVGISSNTNILGSKFVGKINATLKNIVGENVYVGGTVGYAETNPSLGEGDTGVINNAIVGASSTSSAEYSSVTYPTTEFNLTVDKDNSSAVYIGGSVGGANDVAIASNGVGGTENIAGYQEININVKLNDINRALFVGGVVGYASDGMVSGCDALTNINIVGTTTCYADSEGKEVYPIINIGGLAGQYSLAAVSSTSGISECNVKTNIATITEDEELSALNATHIRLSLGVAELKGYSTMKQCLFTGEINTEGSSLSILYVGGAAAFVDSGADGMVDLEQIIVSESSKQTSSIGGLTVGTETTTQLYVGGLVGRANKVAISYSVSWGRIVPITSNDLSTDVNAGIYVGGLIGLIETSASVNNSYTTSSIVADSIANSAIANLNIGALVGEIPNGSTCGNKGNINFKNVYYSSDLALFADENYVRDENENYVPLGSNLSAQVVINSGLWHTELQTQDGTQNEIWKSFKVNSMTRMPYLTYLEEDLIKYGVIVMPSGVNYYDYVLGSVMRPELILSGEEKTFNNEYTYYLLQTSGVASATTPTFRGTLNGILLGQDLTIDETFRVGAFNTVNFEGMGYSAIIAIVGKHSAVSNLNVVIDKEIDATGTIGIIAGLNNGVIFNSSVQGNGIKFKGTSGSLGLIACVNAGLVSYCYSTAEIVESGLSVGGIVHTNSGKLLSNYFTGYIESNASSAGIVFASERVGYVYNNYMAGVITKIETNGNAFHASNTIVGLNNYIDSYSDINYANFDYSDETDPEKAKADAHAILNPVSTAQLMANGTNASSGKLLKGEWYVTVSDGSFNANAKTLGLNYNYPVYRFNRLQGATSADFVVNDWKNQLYTGTGLVYDDENFVTDKDEDGEDDNDGAFTLEERYSRLVNYKEVDGVKTGYQNYVDAFKIPHLGVLTAVQNLLGESRNYVVIYNLDGLYGENYATWKAVGSNTTINGFAQATCGFNGVFVTNKYFAYNYADTTISGVEATDSYCLITNLSKEGLFANIDQAYFGNIKLGNFKNLANSGALGLNIIASATPNVNVDNVLFVGNSVVNGTNTYGGLFGEVQGYLQIGVFNSLATIGTGSLEVPLKLEGRSTSVAGLIAGTSSGTIELLAVTDEDSESLSNYSVMFNGNRYAGGLVGELKGGEIIGNGNVINLYGSDIDSETINMLGGIGGQSTESTTITDVGVNLTGISAVIQFNANGFGGVVGEAGAGGNITVTTGLIISASSTDINFLGDSKENRYYGLLIGLQNADLELETSLEVKDIKKIDIVSSSETSFDEDSDKTGIGVFIGARKDGNIDISYKKFGIEIAVVGIPNVGGIIGYADLSSGGNNLRFGPVETAVVIDESPSSDMFEVKGTTNVGGLFGYLKGDIKSNTFDSNTLSFIGNPFVNVTVNGQGIADETYKNFGGLFGRWDGSNGTRTISGDEVTDTFIGLLNANIINYKNSGLNVANVGGVVGKLTIPSNDEKIIGWLTNSGEVGISSLMDTTEINSLGTENSKVDKSINVGGVIGLVEADGGSATLVQIINSGTISVKGYQNVGGAIGYASGAINIVNDNSVKLEKDEASGIYSSLSHDGSEIQGATIGDGTLDTIAGNVYGAVNVGGFIGYAGEDVKISQVYSKANVYGNVNVGGLVGLSNGATLTNNYLYGEVKTETREDENGDEYEEEIVVGDVKGIYYNYNYKKSPSSSEILTNAFIPTSVGSLVGTATKSEFKNNVIEGVRVTSSKESEGEVISTISNYMARVSASSVGNFTSKEDIYNLDEQSKLNFAEMQSGYGGFVGSIDTETTQASGTENYIVNINVEAQLGINVGTYYGVYRYESDKGEGFITPNTIGEFTVDGAYNIGGIFGYIDGGSGTSKISNISNATINGEAEVTLQSKFSGIYVGGLVGKTNASTVTDLKLSSDTSTKIIIYTNNNYYVGGLIGRAEVNVNGATISGNLGKWTIDDKGTPDVTTDDEYAITDGTDDVVALNNDKAYNFGALIGMLKVGSNSGGLTINVEGNHKMPFTVNAIENSNYYDGESRFNQKETDTGLQLFGEAYYINKDSFNIVGSQDETLYDGTPSNPDYNPVNKYARGWSKEYTGFKQLQRCIPAAENNEKWDSITVLYDAERINHVGTIKNLGLTGVSLPSGNNATKEFADDYICFTIYEEADYDERLYSAMGSAKAYLNPEVDEANVNTTYGTAKDEVPTFLENVWNVLISSTTGPEVYYIDCNSNQNSTNNKDLRGLTYLQWSYKDGENTKWNEFKTLSGKSRKFQNDKGSDGSGDTGITTFMCYFVEDYMSGAGKGQAGDAGKEGTTSLGAYFVFDIVYNNGSMNGLQYKPSKDADMVSVSGKSDSQVSYSGSIFAVSGIYDVDNSKLRANLGSTDWLVIILTIITVVIDVVIIVASFGAGSAITAGKMAVKYAAKKTFVSVVKTFTKAAAKNMLRSVKKMGFKGLCKLIKNGSKKLVKKMLKHTIIPMLLLGFTLIRDTASENYAQPSDYNFGFMSSTYYKDIRYTDEGGQVKLVEASDNAFVDEYGASYSFYSTNRPSDYYVFDYIGNPISSAVISGTHADGKKKITATYNDFATAGDDVKCDEPFNSLDFEWIEACYVTDSIGTENGTDADGNPYTTLELVGKHKDGTYWLMERKYVMKNGQYYINSNAGEIKEIRAVLDFKPDETEPEINYTAYNGGIYVHGSFDAVDGYYYYFDNNDADTVNNNIYQGNNVTYSGGKYYVNGKEITSLATYEGEHINYSINTSKTISDLKAEGHYEGYGYFSKAYYVPESYGNVIKEYTKSGETEPTSLVKYAKFSNRTDEQPTEEGIIYVSQREPYDYFVQNKKGTYKWDDSQLKYVEIGPYETVDEKDRYAKQPGTKTYYYTLVDGELSSSEITSLGANEICVAMYPGTFTNPYGKYPALKSTAYYEAVYVPTSETENIISHNPRYFIYEGGYKVDDDIVYLPVDLSVSETMSARQVSNLKLNASGNVQYDAQGRYLISGGNYVGSDGLTLTGSEVSLTYDNIIKNWNTYKNYYILDSEALVCEMFLVDTNGTTDTGDDVLYKANTEYLIKDALLYKYYVDCSSLEGENNMYMNMYLSNRNVGLYTRYVYKTNNNVVNFSTSKWEGGYTLVPLKGTLLNNGIETVFVETSRVVLSNGNNLRLYYTGSNYQTVNSGTISIK